MRKVKSNALWRGLSAQQQETLDHWLFDEGLSYAKILPRAQSELGFKGQMSSLKRYYVRRDKERTMTKFGDAQVQVAAVKGAPLTEKELHLASMKLLAEFLFQQVRLHPDKVKEWGIVARLIMQNDFTEMLRETKAREHDLRERAMEFKKEKFQIDMVEQALHALPDLQELAQARRAVEPNAYVENAHLNRARRKMFGVVWEVQPESPQEEAEMLAAKREREARHAAEQDAAAARNQKERITEPEPPTSSSPYYRDYQEWKANREAEKKLQTPSSQTPEAERGEDGESRMEVGGDQAPNTNLRASAVVKSTMADKPEKPQAVAKAEQAETEQSPERPEAPVSAAEQTEREKLRQREELAQAEKERLRKHRQMLIDRFEELREICGWQNVSQPPGIGDEI